MGLRQPFYRAQWNTARRDTLDRLRKRLGHYRHVESIRMEQHLRPSHDRDVTGPEQKIAALKI
jgi:hypothetical protein